MKYIVPAESVLWDKQREALKDYSDDVIFIRYASQPEVEQTEYGKQLVCEIQPMPEKGEGVGVGSIRYKYLLSHKDELLALISDDSVTILSDMMPESLYPYRLLMDADEYKGGLHLIGVSPLRFMARKAINGYKDMIKDAGRANSVAVLDSDRYLENVDNRHITMPELLKDVGNKLLGPISAVSELRIEDLRIEDTDEQSYFQYDFTCEKYCISDRENYPYLYHDHDRDNEIRLMGVPAYRPEWGEKEKAPLPPPMPAGKELCRELKLARTQLAQANGIPYESHDCSSEAECGGTCEACDEELRYLNREMEKISEDKRKYPKTL